MPPATVAGLDLVRDEEGELRVLEDNLRMPSGACYAIAVREVGRRRRSRRRCAARLDDYVEELRRRDPRRRPRRRAEPAAAILSDGPENGAWYEHERLGRELGLPVVDARASSRSSRGRLFARRGREREQIDVIYRRLDEDRLCEADGTLTALGELLLPALRSGRLRCANAFGTGLADDKLAHAYVERMVEFYLGEEPLLRSVPSYDLSDEDDRAAAMERLEELVIKPRGGFGGHGVTIMPRATEPRAPAGDRAACAGAPSTSSPRRRCELSSHPTVVGERAAPAADRPAPVRRQRGRTVTRRCPAA